MTRAEPASVVKQTIQALLAVKSHADEILIIDNNHTNEALYKPLARYCNSLPDSLNVRFHHIDHIPGYKAGALNLALKFMDEACDYIVVIDSDYHVLPWARNRIEKAIKRYPNHALLQFPQYYRDYDKADIHAELNHYFSHHLNRNNNQSRALSTGTCAVIKKQALLRLGGWCSDSITEDAQMGVLLHLNEERSQYINEIIATGMLPLTVADLIAQRRRWIYGNMQVLRNYCKILVTSLLAKGFDTGTLTYCETRLSASLSATTTNSAKEVNFSNRYFTPSYFEDKSEKNGAGNQRLKGKYLFVGYVEPRYLRAHLSQLTAWVNFTGIFMILHVASLGGLLAATSLRVPSLIPPSLTVLKWCYGSYTVFMARRLLAYMSDSKPLQTPNNMTADNIASESMGSESIASRKISEAVARSSKTPSLVRPCFIDNEQQDKECVSKNQNKNKKNNDGYCATANASLEGLYNQSDDEQPLFSTLSTESERNNRPHHFHKVKAHKVKACKRSLSKIFNTTNSKIIQKFAKKLSVQAKHRITKNFVATIKRSSRKRLAVVTSQSKTPPDAKTPLVSRLRAWLVHLNFWELGALSWFPVLWGQKRPFVCTPKIDNAQHSLRSLWATVAVIPKFLIILNALTAIVVWSYSAKLFAYSVALLFIKLAAGWVLMTNFSEVSSRLTQEMNDGLKGQVSEFNGFRSSA